MAYKKVKIPSQADPVGTEYQIRIRSLMNGNFLTAEKLGSLSVNRSEAKTWETWTATKLDKHQISLRSFHGKYLCAGIGGIAVANRSERKVWEVWTVENYDDAFAFRSYKGTYLSVSSSMLVTYGANEVKRNEKFDVLTVWDDERPAKQSYSNILKAYDVGSDYALLLSPNNITIQRTNTSSSTAKEEPIVIDFADVKAIEKGYHFLFKELHIHTHKEVKYIIRKVYDFGDAYWRIWKAWKSYQLDNITVNNPIENVEQQKSDNIDTVQKAPMAVLWQKPLVPRSSTESTTNNIHESKELFQQQQQQQPESASQQQQQQPQSQPQWQQASYEKNQIQGLEHETLQSNSESRSAKQLSSAIESDSSRGSTDSKSNESDEQKKLQRRFALVDLNEEIDDEVLELNEKLEDSFAAQHKMKRRTVLEDPGNIGNKSLNKTENADVGQAHPQLLSVPKRNGGPKRRPPQQRPHS